MKLYNGGKVSYGIIIPYLFNFSPSERIIYVSFSYLNSKELTLFECSIISQLHFMMRYDGVIFKMV